MERKDFRAVVISNNKPVSRVLTDNYLDVLVPECAAEEKTLVKVRLDEVRDQINIGRIL